MQSWQYVLLAFLLFSVPAAVGYVMIRERPALAEELLSPVMVARAEAAAENLAEGRGYAETTKEDRPQVAALIITNNITVSFGTFVGGLTAGVLTTWLLFANGMMFGLVLGLFRNYQALSYLLTFVLGHGVLELTAIFISAGAGFRLAKAMDAARRAGDGGPHRGPDDRRGCHAARDCGNDRRPVVDLAGRGVMEVRRERGVGGVSGALPRQRVLRN